MKFYSQVALALFAFAVVALAVPTNKPRKVFRPNRVNRRIEGTTAIRTYQPKYNPFKSTELSTSTLSSVSPLELNVSSPSPTKVPIATLIEDLSTDPTFVAAPVEETSVTLSSDSSRSKPGREVPIPFSELEAFSPSSEAASSSPPPKAPLSSTSKPLISSSATKPSNTPILLRPSNSISPFFKSQNSQSLLNSSVLQSIPKSLESSASPSSASGTSIRVPKTLTSSVFPSPTHLNRPPANRTQTSVASIPPSSTSSSTSLRSPKSLSAPVSPSFSQKSKSPVSTVSSHSFVSEPSRNTKSASLQVESDDSANSASVNYSFSYKVTDPITNQDFGHSENRVGKNTKGRYDVLLPDGRRQVVDYRILNDSGYVADVTYQD